ncbi:hypothetical protein XI03_37245 [Bradyrhizobium sp. CCBAU 65884]|nr:hypothetical protein [Bradyrhizobium sp. CCBAU 65884]
MNVLQKIFAMPACICTLALFVHGLWEATAEPAVVSAAGMQGLRCNNRGSKGQGLHTFVPLYIGL